MDFILASNSRNAIREVLAPSVPQFPGSPMHSGARSFGVGQVLVQAWAQHLQHASLGADVSEPLFFVQEVRVVMLVS